MNARRAVRVALLLGAPFAAASGCLLPSFERVPEPLEPVVGGTAGSTSGTGGAAMGGSSPGGYAGASGEGGADAGEGGSGGAPVTIAVYKQYEVEQGTELSVSASEGLFVYSGPDDREWTNVRSFSRDTSLPASVATLDVDPADGSFTFAPSAEMFGVYHATYVLENARNETATGELYITVQPVAIDLGVVENGIGGFTVTGQSAEGIGRAVAGAGDVDRDGYDDFLVGAPEASGGDGLVYVVFGAADHASFELDPTPRSGARYAVLSGSGTEALGTSVAGAGDLDGDGFADFVLGAPGELGASNGRAYAVFGRARNELGGAIRDVVADGGYMLTRAGNENVGTLVAGGADVTGDATPDLVVFASSSRTFYVVDGVASADVDLDMEAGQLRGSTTLDTNQWRAVSFVGDVDGDGAGELLVGTGLVAALLTGPASTYPRTLDPATFLAENGVLVENAPPLGFVATSPGGDFDGDGALDSVFCHARNSASDRCRLFLGMPASATEGSSVTGFGSGDVRVAGGGDTSGDGLGDLSFSETTSASSRAWVLFGREQPSASLNLQNLGARGYSIAGGSAIEAVALGGDIDGPSRDGARTQDLLVGDTAAAGGNGRVTVIFGGRFSR